MNRHARLLAIVAGLVVLAAVLAALGFAFTRGASHEIRFPGRIAVRTGCGLRHMWLDASDQRKMCLQYVFDTVSVSRNGDKLAWDTTNGGTIYVSGIDGWNPRPAAVPPGSNSAPSLSPDGTKIAFLHSPRNDGQYDIWVTETGVATAEQETNTRNVSDVAWSPTGDWLAYVQNWNENTLEGQVSLVRPDGDDAHTLVNGDAPDWSPDGKHLVYVHNGSIWTIDADGTDAHRLIRDGHSPAWSRNGKMIAFMRAQKCDRNICPEHAYVAFSDGTHAQPVGPLYPSERQVVWLPDPFE
jgi:Tol biopolymer transport system component